MNWSGQWLRSGDEMTTLSGGRDDGHHDDGMRRFPALLAR